MKRPPDDLAFDRTLHFEVGDRVRWRTLGAGGRERHAVIVAVVREDDDPYKCIPSDHKPPRRGYGRPRFLRSYLVAVPGNGRGQSVAYWPRIDSLTPEG